MYPSRSQRPLMNLFGASFYFELFNLLITASFRIYPNISFLVPCTNISGNTLINILFLPCASQKKRATSLFEVLAFCLSASVDADSLVELALLNPNLNPCRLKRLPPGSARQSWSHLCSYMSAPSYRHEDRLSLQKHLSICF